MEELSAVIKSVCIISAAICLLEGITEGTRLKNQMKFLLNMIFVIVIAAPFLRGTATLELPDISRYTEPEYSDADELYREEMAEQTGLNISTVLRQQLEAAGVKCEDIQTDVNISETNSISISKVTVISSNFAAAEIIIRNSLGEETEVINGNA